MKCPNCNKEVEMLPYMSVDGHEGYECPECHVTFGQATLGSFFKTKVDTSKFNWMILDEEKAKELHIDIIKIDENHAIISADIAFIPDGVSIEEYYDYLQETGILINNKTLKEKYGRS